MIGYLDKVLRPINLILPKTSGHIKTFTVTDGNKDKNIELMFFHMDDEKLLENIKLFGLRLKSYKIKNQYKQRNWSCYK